MIKKLFTGAIGALVLANAVDPAIAGAYKCTGSDGSVTYQQVPCPKGSKEQIPRTAAGPTLTDEEKFNAAAYQAGLSPDEARALLSDDRNKAHAAPPTSATAPPLQTDEPPPANPKELALRCRKPNGYVYYSRTGCGASRRVNDSADVVDRKEACAEAKRLANERRKNTMNLSFEERSKLDNAVYDLCSAGRRFGD